MKEFKDILKIKPILKIFCFINVSFIYILYNVIRQFKINIIILILQQC